MEWNNSGWFVVVLPLEEDGLSAGGDSVVHAGRVTMYAHFADEGPAVDSLDLEFALLWRLILMWAT